MKSRERILARLKTNQPNSASVHRTAIPHGLAAGVHETFMSTLGRIGGSALNITSLNQIALHITDAFPLSRNVISVFPEIKSSAATTSRPHDLASIDVAILKGDFAVAENGAVWITDRSMMDRALPFICENLVLVIDKDRIVPTLHEAYEIIGNSTFDYGTFIAGPSKTADIEQSLVLGAHGPKTLTVCVMENH